MIPDDVKCPHCGNEEFILEFQDTWGDGGQQWRRCEGCEKHYEIDWEGEKVRVR